MPVFPLVGSTIVEPGFSLPSRSAVSIILEQIRSFTDPPGLNASNFAQTSASSLPGKLLSLRTGVEPIRSRMDPAPFDIANAVLDFPKRVNLEKICGYAIYLPNQSQLNAKRAHSNERPTGAGSISRSVRRLRLLLTGSRMSC